MIFEPGKIKKIAVLRTAIFEGMGKKSNANRMGRMILTTHTRGRRGPKFQIFNPQIIVN